MRRAGGRGKRQRLSADLTQFLSAKLVNQVPSLSYFKEKKNFKEETKQITGRLTKPSATNLTNFKYGGKRRALATQVQLRT